MKLRILRTLSFVLLAGHITLPAHSQESRNQRNSDPFTEADIAREYDRLDDLYFYQKDFRGLPIKGYKTSGFAGLFWSKGSKEYYVQQTENGVELFSVAKQAPVAATGILTWNEEDQLFTGTGYVSFSDPRGICPDYRSKGEATAYVVSKSQAAWSGALNTIRIKTTQYNFRSDNCGLRTPTPIEVVFSRSFVGAEWDSLMVVANRLTSSFASDLRSILTSANRYEIDRLTETARNLPNFMKIRGHEQLITVNERAMSNNMRRIDENAEIASKLRKDLNEFQAKLSSQASTVSSILSAGVGRFNDKEVKINRQSDIPAELKAEANSIWEILRARDRVTNTYKEAIEGVHKREIALIQAYIDEANKTMDEADADKQKALAANLSQKVEKPADSQGQ